MGNITTTLTSYPGSLDTRSTLVDGVGNDQMNAVQVNGPASAIIALETELGTDPAGTALDVKTRLDVSQNNDGTIKSSVVAAGSGANVSYSGGVFTIGWSPDGPGYVQNLGIEVTANSPVANALRIRLVQRSGATQTAASPSRIAFPVATASTSPSNGAYVVRDVTGDTQMQISSGSTLGTIVNEDCRIYVGVLDNNGTVECVAWNPKLTVPATTSAVPARVAHLFTPNEVATLSTTAEGGAGGADSAATLYSTTARSGVYVRRLGYVDIKVGSTLGNWNANPTQIVMAGPGVPMTGDILRTVSTTTYGIVKTGSTVIPIDGTIPQNTEGDLYLWASLTTSNVRHPLLVTSVGNFSASAAAQSIVNAFFRNSEASAFAVSTMLASGNNETHSMPMSVMLATTTSAETGIYLRSGSTSGTIGMNASSAAVSHFGEANQTYLTIQEICA